MQGAGQYLFDPTIFFSSVNLNFALYAGLLVFLAFCIWRIGLRPFGPFCSEENYYVGLGITAVVSIFLVLMIQELALEFREIILSTSLSPSFVRMGGKAIFEAHGKPEIFLFLAAAILFIVGGGYAFADADLSLGGHILTYTLSVGPVEEMSKAFTGVALYYFFFRSATHNQRGSIISAFGIAGLGFGIGEAFHYYAQYQQADADISAYLLRCFWCAPLHFSWSIIVGYRVADRLAGEFGMASKNHKRLLWILFLAAIPSIVLHGCYDAFCVHDPFASVVVGLLSIGWALFILKEEFIKRLLRYLSIATLVIAIGWGTWQLWQIHVRNRDCVSLVEQGKVAERNGDWAGAQADYDKALQIKPNEATALQQQQGLPQRKQFYEFTQWMRQGGIAENNQQWENAKTAYGKALETLPGNPAAVKKCNYVTDKICSNLVVQGDGAEEKYDWNNATLAYSNALALNAGFSSAAIRLSDVSNKKRLHEFSLLISQARTAEENTDWVLAKAAIEKAIELKPEDSSALQERSVVIDKYYAELVMQGESYQRTNQFTSARRAYEEALKLKPANPSASKLIQLLEESESAFNIKQWLDAGNFAVTQKNWDPAIANFDKILTITPTNKDVLASKESALFNKGVSLAESGWQEEAIICYDRALSLNASKAVLIYDKKGVALVKLGQLVEARTCFDKAISIDQQFEMPWRNEVALLANSGQIEETISLCNKALVIFPNNTFFLQIKDQITQKQRATAELEAKRAAETAKAEAIIAASRQVSIYLSQAAAARERGNLVGAKLACESALKIDPNNADAWFLKAQTLDAMRAYSGQTTLVMAYGLQASSCYRKYLQFAPKRDGQRILQANEALAHLQAERRMLQ